jgi:hypothetical protein
VEAWAVINSIAVVLLLVLLFGCARFPTWSKASPEQRASRQFRMDDAYRQTPEFKAGIEASAERVEALKEQIKRNANRP